MKSILALVSKLIAGRLPQLKIASAALASWGVTWALTKFTWLSELISEDWRAEVVNYVGLGIWVAILAIYGAISGKGINDLKNILPDPSIKPNGIVDDATRASLKITVNEAAGKVIAPVTLNEAVALNKVQAAHDNAENVPSLK